MPTIQQEVFHLQFLQSLVIACFYILLKFIIDFVKQMESLTNKYDAMGEGQTSIKQHYHSIIQFKKSLAKMHLLISLPSTDQQQRSQIIQMQESVQIALKEETTLLREMEKKKNLYPLSVDLLVGSDIGKLAKCYIEAENKWRNSIVLEVDVEEQTAKIKRYGKQGTIIQLPAYLLKVLKQPDPNLFEEGCHCKAIYSGDGEFYPCIIEKITPQGYQVRYKKYNSQEVVQLHRLRPMVNQSEKQQDIKFEDLQEFKVPNHLKIMPNDPQNVKKSKKTKVKALKFAFKNAQVDQVNKQKQDKWKEWNNNSSKVGYFKTRHDLDIINSKNKK